MTASTAKTYVVQSIEHCPIPTRDGRLLSARLWMPKTNERVPAVLEYIPYRKRDYTRARDEPIHAYIAARGYVGVRLDLAGSGESEGVLRDEYLPQEQEDALDAIAWLAKQPWCNGVVGMIGKSWGGFNCLQIAALRPPALRAIVPVCATDDRYGDDVHYMGGCLLIDGIEWGAMFQTYLPRPPDPQVLGSKWRDVWQQRLEDLTCPLEHWLGHPRRDHFWKHGSVCENYRSIQAATLLVGGWADGYKNAMLRMAEHLPGPTQCIMGSWGHLYPHSGVPGPAIGFLQEVVRWYDHWLKGIENGVMQEPKLRAFIQDSEPPKTHYSKRAGRWVGEQRWPSPSIHARTLHLTNQGLTEDAAPLTETELPYNLAVGHFGGDWGAIALPYELAPDQRPDDALSLCFDTEPLAEDFEILGSSTLRLRVSCDKPIAMVAARLNEVRPDGGVCKIALGLLSLNHHTGPEWPTLLEPGQPYDLAVPISAAGYRIPSGHRLRIALSPSYWPIAWPSPEPTKIRLIRGSLALPQRIATAEPRVKFGPPEEAPGPRMFLVQPSAPFRRITVFDYVNGIIRRCVDGTNGLGGEGLTRLEDVDLELRQDITREQSVATDDPISASTEYHQRMFFRRDQWEVSVRTRVRLVCTAAELLLSCYVEVEESGVIVLSRSWNPTFQRAHL